MLNVKGGKLPIRKKERRMSGFHLALFVPMAIAVVSMGRNSAPIVNMLGALILVVGLIANVVYC